jgi:hypothetical protein
MIPLLQIKDSKINLIFYKDNQSKDKITLKTYKEISNYPNKPLNL